MVYEDSSYRYDYSQCDVAFGSSNSLDTQQLKQVDSEIQMRLDDSHKDDAHLVSFKMPYQRSFKANNWSELAESTLPLRSSVLMRSTNYGGVNHEGGHKLLLGGGGSDSMRNGRRLSHHSDLFHDSLERQSKEMSRKLIYVNFISLLINLLLAIVALYFSFVSDSSSTTAFAADCLLDLISSAIVLWRYYGDLNDVYMHAREQIACIYLGALFEISAIGIMIKASSDIVSGPEAAPAKDAPGYDLLYLAMAAVIACSVLIAFKWSLYTTIRDKSILLDVINTVISTIFALTLCLMTILSNFDASFWYFDPVLSIVLALFMAGFGLKVIHQNFHILRPKSNDTASFFESPFAKLNSPKGDFHSSLNQAAQNQYGTDANVRPTNWQKADHTLIAFI